MRSHHTIVVMMTCAHRSGNPYIGLLEQALSDTRVLSADERARSVLEGSVDIVHVHWPEKVLSRRTHWGRIRAIGKLAAILLVARLKRIPVVWTVHNLQDHDERHPRLEWAIRRLLARVVDGVIAMSETVAATVYSEFPALAGKPCRVVPHGHYRSVYPQRPSRTLARQRLGLEEHAKILLFIGLIRPYKNVPLLMEAFRELPGQHHRLLVVGRVPGQDLSRLKLLAQADQRVVLNPRFVSDEELACYLAAADLVVFPFRTILNSGSVLVALSFDRPVLVPPFGALIDLRRQLGERWVRVFEPPLTAASMAAALGDLPGDNEQAPLDDFDWGPIGRQTANFYRYLLRRDRPP